MQLIAKPFDELTGDEVYEILRARCEVFNIEQNIHYLDPDGVDKRALHCFFWEEGQVAAYLRAYLNEGGDGKAIKVGRVLTRARGQGVGRALMEQSIEAIKMWQPVAKAPRVLQSSEENSTKLDVAAQEGKSNCRVITMDAQRHAEGFYAKLGFSTVSDIFLEEGVEHVKMEMKIRG